MMGNARQQHLVGLLFGDEPATDGGDEFAPDRRPELSKLKHERQRLQHMTGGVRVFRIRVGLSLKTTVALAEVV